MPQDAAARARELRAAGGHSSEAVALEHQAAEGQASLATFAVRIKGYQNVHHRCQALAHAAFVSSHLSAKEALLADKVQAHLQVWPPHSCCHNRGYASYIPCYCWQERMPEEHT